MPRTDLVKHSFDARFIEVGCVLQIAVARYYGVVGVLGEAQDLGIVVVGIGAPHHSRFGHAVVTVRQKGRDGTGTEEQKGTEQKEM